MADQGKAEERQRQAKERQRKGQGKALTGQEKAVERPRNAPSFLEVSSQKQSRMVSIAIE